MNNDIYLIGEVGYDVTLQKTIDLVNQSDKTKPLNVHIHSPGGYVYEGRAIYNYLKSLDQEVNTIAVGLVASIASVIMLAGKTKSAYSQNNILIHLPSNVVGGNAKDLEAVAKDLREEEQKLANVYVDETGFTNDEAMALMQEDRMMNDEEIKKFGLVIKEYKAVAKFGENNLNNDNKNMSEQLTKTEALSWFEKLENLFKSSLKEEAPTNKIVQDANGTEINFPDVPNDQEPLNGSKATIEGKNANGDYVMPSGDTYRFTNSILEIVPKVEEVVNEVVNTLNLEIAELKEQLIASNLLVENSIKEVDTIKNEFTELKNTISSSFEVDGKTKQPKDEKQEVTRTTFKSKNK